MAAALALLRFHFAAEPPCAWLRASNCCTGTEGTSGAPFRGCMEVPLLQVTLPYLNFFSSEGLPECWYEMVMS